MQVNSWMELPRGSVGSTERHARIIADSYRRLLGRPLLAAAEAGEGLAPLLFEADIVVLSHGTEPDPVLNYGNRAALRLWEMDFSAFTRMPSRQTAEPLIQADRERFMQTVAERGFADDYTGIRISSSGRRFELQNAVVFNLQDEAGRPYGQAAAITRYRYV